MKYEPTFTEMSEIFAAIANAETKVEKYVCAEADYNAASHEYTESNYDIQMGMIMSRNYAAMENARKAMDRQFKKVLVALGADKDTDYESESLRNEAGRTYEPHRFIYSARYAAVKLARNMRA